MTILTRTNFCDARASRLHSPSVPRLKARLAAFLTSDDDWIARNEGKTMALVLTAAMVLPGVIEWMI